MKTPIDDYLENVPEQHREELEFLRRQIRAIVPDSEEVISYMIPTFKWKGMLVGFASCKTHLSFYVMSGTFLSKFKDELKDFSMTKSAVHFTPDKRIPAILLERMIKERMVENEEKELVKKQKKK
jgi:uncharacterized protein YdhG (YjbR/CyaY superfamily)